MDNMEISTEPSLLEVELPQTLLESPSVSTFLPDEEASICPLLSSNTALGQTLISHPLSPNVVPSDITSSNISNTDCKAETSSSGSSTGIAMETTASLFNKVNYHHLQNNNITTQEASAHCLKVSRRKSKDTPSFVSWNWPLIRKCTFFVFVSAILAICSIVVAKIVSMPKTCNPKTAWYRGSVFYEIDPASFKDTNNDGIGDINGIINEIDYFVNLEISGVRLNSIFSSHYVSYINATSINIIRPELGNLNSVRNLAKLLHSHNLTLLLDLPLQHVIAAGKDSEALDVVSKSILHWINQGVNGFYLKGLESYTNTGVLLTYLSSWKRILGPNRVLIVGEYLLKNKSKPELSAMFEHIDLVDFVLDIEKNSQNLKKFTDNILSEMPIGDDKTWVQWSIGGNFFDRLNTSQPIISKLFAATIMQLILPGTPNIMHRHEILIAQRKNHTYSGQTTQLMNDELLNRAMSMKSLDELTMVHRMISLRERSPSIYKKVICKSDINKPNTQILTHSSADILIIVRNYPRKNSFVSITNFGNTKVNLDLTSNFYSGTRMLIVGSAEKIYFKQFLINAFNTIVVKLDK
ncbi:uncharacterized protein LOC26528439 isoform X1 [Drosophila mojavensis]|uniref:Uncharacterized protein, isoform A n=1 Tax=Drosophila mojavensis TaxID=7230 RepID=A0A0Q9XJJ1_DROMO|nr:uncharacterized protein LOC26528439 isoform X1 [Drosophila mojavensis]KRG03827.1 uncharacterized protein Dmoj_GI26798, isoform A [Drosophila mojavensis]